MHFLLIPVPNGVPVALRIRPTEFLVNSVEWDFDGVPATGPVRRDGDTILIEYDDQGGPSMVNEGTDHTADWIPSTTRVVELPPPEPEPEVTADPRAERLAATVSLIVDLMGLDSTDAETLLTTTSEILGV